VLCSSVDGNNSLSAIRTCYEKPTNITSDGPTTQTDCATITASSPFALCSGDYPIQLTAYTAPDSSSTSTGSTATAEPTATATTAPSTTAAAPATPTTAPTRTPIQPHVPRAQPFCQLVSHQGFCGLLWFCEWSAGSQMCNGRKF
ncbi:hypothetical protein BBJ29_007706, partial [Phytophthora kernoviae]